MQPAPEMELRGISAAQLLNWAELCRRTVEEYPRLAQAARQLTDDTDGTAAPLTWTEEEGVWLNVIYNNVFTEGLACSQTTISVQRAKEQGIVLGDSIHMPTQLCVKHRYVEMHRAVSDSAGHEHNYQYYTDVPLDPLPEGLPLLLSCLLGSYVQHCASVPQIRVFACGIVKTANDIANTSPPWLQRTVRLAPVFLKDIGAMRQAYLNWMLQQTTLQSRLSNSVTCMYCFPSMLSAAAHAMMCHYVPTQRSLPTNMRPFVAMSVPWDIAPDTYAQAMKLCKIYLTGAQSRNEQRRVQAASTCKGESIRRVYDRLMTQIWSRSDSQLHTFQEHLVSLVNHILMPLRLWESLAQAQAFHVQQVDVVAAHAGYELYTDERDCT